MALFPEGSPSRAFFDFSKCPYNSYKDVPTWFCGMSYTIGLFERPAPRPHEEEIKAFIAYDEGRSGELKAKKPVELQGQLAGMEMSAFGFEEKKDDVVHETVVFLGTQTMPDGSGIAIWCKLAAGQYDYADQIPKCHEGMKILRDRMVELHKK